MGIINKILDNATINTFKEGVILILRCIARLVVMLLISSTLMYIIVNAPIVTDIVELVIDVLDDIYGDFGDYIAVIIMAIPCIKIGKKVANKI